MFGRVIGFPASLPADWVHEEDALIGAFDLLGFKSLMEGDSGLVDASHRVSSLLRAVSSAGASERRFTVNETQSSIQIHTIQASDTIIVYGK